MRSGHVEVFVVRLSQGAPCCAFARCVTFVRVFIAVPNVSQIHSFHALLIIV